MLGTVCRTVQKLNATEHLKRKKKEKSYCKMMLFPLRPLSFVWLRFNNFMI